MARPNSFHPRIGRLIIAHIALGKTRGQAAEAAGVGLRTVQYWLAKGRNGDPLFDGFANRLDQIADSVREASVMEYFEREAVKSKVRWQIFKASRERWWLDRLGPGAFWLLRLRWCESKHKHRGAVRALTELRAFADPETG